MHSQQLISSSTSTSVQASPLIPTLVHQNQLIQYTFKRRLNHIKYTEFPRSPKTLPRRMRKASSQALSIFSRVFHALLALFLSLLLIRGVWNTFELVVEDAQKVVPNVTPPGLRDDYNTGVQDIAQSFNTFWNSWDPDHCRNICMTSRQACKLWDCEHVPGVKVWT